MEPIPFDIPEKCRDCMILRDYAGRILLNATMRDMEFRRATSIMGLACDTEELLVADITGAEDMAGSQVVQISKEITAKLDEYDEVEAGYQEDQRRLAWSCEGVQWQDITIHGITYAIGVCTAPVLLPQPGDTTVMIPVASKLIAEQPTNDNE